MRIISVGLLTILILTTCFTGKANEAFIPEAEAGSSSLTAVYKNMFPQPVTELRGKILAVVTSTAEMGSTGKTTGYELVELARAYYLFKANGFEVEIISPRGGKAPVVIDDDLSEIDRAFLVDPVATQKVNNTLRPDQVDSREYSAIYFVGGKGAMFDFPEDTALQKLTAAIYENQGVVSATCHGPAALLNVVLSNGEYLVSNKRVNSFTNEEELLLTSDARDIFPFLLEDKLKERGGLYEKAPVFLQHVAVDGRLVTAQNPWSTWAVAEAVVTQLGYEPVFRQQTNEEKNLYLIQTYFEKGYREAEALLASDESFSRRVLALYGLVSLWKGDFSNGFALLWLSI